MPAEEANADATASTTSASEEKSSEAGAPPAVDAADATTAEAGDGKSNGKSKNGNGDKKDVTKTIGAQNLAVAGGQKGRPFFISAALQFRTPVVNDTDPANDRSMNYLLTGGFKLFEGGFVLARMSLNQRFVAEGGEFATELPQGVVSEDFDSSVNDSGLRLGNLNLMFMYTHGLKLDLGEFSRDLVLLHRGGVYLPTSREAQVQNFYLGLEGLSMVRMNVIDSLFVNVAGLAQWRGHEYAEQAGLNGLTLPRFVFFGQLALEYVVALGDFGSLTFGADINGSETVKYPARDDFESPNSAAVYVAPGYGYDVYAVWLPLPFLSAGIAWEQGGNVLRNGIVNTFFFHRDETRLSFTLTARY